jgi:nucleoside-diphosphate-sugar epimerase
MKDSSVLVTGANGFLGKNILTLLRNAGLTIFATDIAEKPAIQDVAYQKADITHSDQLKKIVEVVTTVVHAAGLAHIFHDAHKNHELFHQINETGSANMAMAAAEKGVCHFILVSSVSVYGPFTHAPCSENAPCQPVGPYAKSKFNAELRVAEIAEKTGMALTILRLATLYGEGDPGNVGRLIRNLDQGRFVWIGDGSNRKSLLYKEDAARACMTVASLPAAGTRVFNVSAPPCTMREIVDSIAEALGKQPLPMRIPGKLALVLSRNLSRLPHQRLAGLHQTVQKWMAEDVYDSQLFNRTFDFTIRTPLKEGIRKEVDWYLRFRKGK